MSKYFLSRDSFRITTFQRRLTKRSDKLCLQGKRCGAFKRKPSLFLSPLEKVKN